MASLTTQEFGDNRRICSEHFHETDYGPTKKLKLDALPKEYLSEDGTSNSLDEIELDQPNLIPDAQVPILNLDQIFITNSDNIDQEGNILEPNKDLIIENLNEKLRIAMEEHLQAERVNKEKISCLESKLREEKTSSNKTINKLKVKNKRLQENNKNKNKKIDRLKNKVSILNESVQFEKQIEKLPEPVRKFIFMQINHIKRKKWEEHEKQFAFIIYYKSPKLYTYLRDKAKFALPSVGQIRLWVNEIDLFPDKTNNLLKILKIRCAEMNAKERECVLIWDELSIKKWLEYNSKKDMVEGFVDLGEEGRSAAAANHALVFMMRGRQYNWRQPISYYLASNSVAGDVLVPIILKVLDFIESAGFIVKSKVCDLGKPNERAVKLLGITPERPYIERFGRKIFFNYDPPHLIKCLRNNMLNHDFNVGGEIASFKAIIELYEKEKNLPAKSAPKLTERHIYPDNFFRMKVAPAAQVISNSVSAALLAGKFAPVDPLQNEHCVPTANFLKKANDLFDCLNSRSPKDPNPLRRPLSEYNKEVVTYLKSSLDYIKTWKLMPKNGKSVPNPACFKGFYLTVNSVLMQWEDMKLNGAKYLLTSRLNQDPLENLFAVLRSRSGHCPNPTARQLRQNLQYSVTANVKVLSLATNCEPDSTVPLLFSIEDHDESASIAQEDPAPAEKDISEDITEDVANELDNSIEISDDECNPEVCETEVEMESDEDTFSEESSVDDPSTPLSQNLSDKMHSVTKDSPQF